MTFKNFLESCILISLIILFSIFISHFVGFKLMFFILSISFMILSILLKTNIKFHEYFIKNTNKDEYNKYLISNDMKRKRVKESNVVFCYAWAAIFLLNGITTSSNLKIETDLLKYFAFNLLLIISIASLGIILFKKYKNKNLYIISSVIIIMILICVISVPFLLYRFG